MRKSGIELLRILSLLGVIMIHYWEQACQYAVGANYHTLLLLRSVSSSAVDVFILITGYFMCMTNKRTWGKPLNLIIQVMLINEGAYLIKSFFGIEPTISLRHITSSLLPDSYFTTLFVALYIISPYINKMTALLTPQGWKKLLVITISIFSVYQTAIDVFSEVIGKEIMGLSTIGAWGGQKGFNIVNFILLYIVGSYLRYNPIILQIKQIRLLLIVCVLLIFAWAETDLIFRSSTPFSAWLYHNPIVILLGVMLLLYFKELNFYSNFVNIAAKSVYTCFLAHCQLITIVKIEDFAKMSLPVMLLHYALLAILCYVAFWLLWYIYDKCTNSFYKRLDKKEISYNF